MMFYVRLSVPLQIIQPYCQTLTLMLDPFFSCGILTTDTLTLACLIPQHIHRSHDAWTGISVDRPSGLPDWHRHHLFGVQSICKRICKTD